MVRIVAFAVAVLLPSSVSAQVAYSWGYNGEGELGNNSSTNSPVPVAVSTTGVLNGQTIVSVAAGGVHGLALAANGKAYSWGFNGDGELGNGTTTPTSVPVAVSTAGVLNNQTVTAITAGIFHSLAVAGGKVYAWGNNGYGQLGDGSTLDRGVPVAVSTAGVLNNQTVTAIAAGFSHSMALANGQVFAWGGNAAGQLGVNSISPSGVPVAVSSSGTLNGKTATAIAAGGSHSLAVANGKAYAWGDNGNGQLGIDTTLDSHVPVAVSTAGALNGLTVTAVAGGGDHSLAVANGKVYAWGLNSFGQLGNNSTAQSNIPVAVSSAELNGLTVTKVAAGTSSSYALTSTGRLFAWGDNTYGELGIGSAVAQFTTPQEVFAPNGLAWTGIDSDAFGYAVVATLTPVPEPGLLLALGVAGGLWRLRQRKRSRPA